MSDFMVYVFFGCIAFLFLVFLFVIGQAMGKGIRNLTKKKQEENTK